MGTKENSTEYSRVKSTQVKDSDLGYGWSQPSGCEIH